MAQSKFQLVRVSALTCLLLFSVGATADEGIIDLKPAQKAVRLKDFNKAFSLYTKAANAGNAEAQYQLANLYLVGQGTKKNTGKGLLWLEKAAAQKHTAALYTLGIQSISEKPGEAIKLIQASADQGFVLAENYLERLGKAPEDNKKNEHPLSDLWFGSVKNNDINELKKLSAQIGNPNLEDQHSRNALFPAVESKSTDALEWLIEEGADIDHVDRFGFTPLFMAVKEDNIGQLRILLPKSKKPNHTLPNGDSLLHYALRLQHTNITKYLIKKNIAINTENRDGWTPLDLAEYGELKEIALLIANKEGKKGSGWSNLPEQAVHEQLAETWSLPENETKLEFSDLAKTIVAGNKPLARYLIEKNPTWVNQPLEDNSSLLSLAIKNQNVDMATMLLSFGAEPDYPLLDGETALHLAARSKINDLVVALLDAGANPQIKSKSNLDAVEIAIFSGNEIIVYTLTEHLINSSNTENFDQYLLFTTMHSAQRFSSIFLPYAKKVVKDEQGRNTLWYAAENQDNKLVVDLLNSPLNYLEADNNGKTPFFVAVENGCMKCAQSLISRSDLNQTTLTNNSPLISAAETKNADMVKWLITNGADTEQRNTNGDTALILAVRASDKNSVQHLIDAGANISRKNKRGDSAIDLAKDKPEIHAVLKEKAVLGIF